MTIPKYIQHIPSPKKEYSYDLAIMQQRLQDILDEFTDREINDSVFLESKAIGTSTTLIEHTLGRAYRGWYIVDKNANADIWRDTTDTNDTTLFLALKADAAVTVSIVIF